MCLYIRRDVLKCISDLLGNNCLEDSGLPLGFTTLPSVMEQLHERVSSRLGGAEPQRDGA